MFNPPSPRELLFELIGNEEVEVEKKAEVFFNKIGCGAHALDWILDETLPVTPAMALGLERIGAGSAEHWLTMQNAYDLFHLRGDSKKEYIQR